MNASGAEMAAWQRAARPVYRELEADPQTASLIDAIRGLAGTSANNREAPTCDDA
ncbi:MAG: hypothetical protein WD096_09645 [Actinomycetota bacterium]